MKTNALIIAGMVGLALFLAPLKTDAKKLKPRYYKSCYSDYSEMRKMVPKPSMDVEKTAKTISTVAGIAGRFGGFGGGLGSMASTASTVAQYSETISDVAAFTEGMSASFPNASDRYAAYGERMGTEADDMQKVADFSMASQECYAAAYTELKTAVENGDMKTKDAKKRHKEITTGVANVSEMLDHAVIYMDNNIAAYNQALTQETTGAGLNLDNLLGLATEAQSVATKVDNLTPDSGDVWAGSGWTTTEAKVEAHRQVMAAQYRAAGMANPYQAPTQSADALFGGFGSLTSLAALGSISPAVAANVALQSGVAQANLATAGYDQSLAEAVPAAAAPAGDDKVAALMKAGADTQPYLDAYGRIKALGDMQRGFTGFVNKKPY
ncbi:MAG: hypothetical protein JJ921_15115 [Pseudomonadales bacterium]|nr:hypothetical protein [Pseudomonadales bacterium]MBO7004274.1 hypothetical protein [Pseudomonadales bacterium]